jgi:uncharacterized repeat protein (TIGR02543 family)
MSHKCIYNITLFLTLSVVFSLGVGVAIAPVQAAPMQQAGEITFSGEELLGRPTDSSITINVVPDENINLYYEYGTTSGVYSNQTTTGSATGGQPYEVVISGLQPDTHYYYRMQYQKPGDVWIARPEYSFWTQRASGSTFTFTITSDSHVNIMLGNATTWTQTMTNVANDNPDFEIDLGDTFAMDSVTTVSGAEQAYLYQRQFFDLVGNSAPIFLAPGNHEQEEAWHLDDTGNPATSPPVLGANARKKFYPNPVPDSFYTGNTDASTTALDGDHLREDYYAWTWGDALFVVIDPFWYTTTKPYTGNQGGGESSDTGSGDRWDWTLGLTQFNWLEQTLQNSTAKYKFIFAHHMVGGSDDYVRGGANPANLVEWGGYNENGTTWGWDTNRAVAQWGSEPVHQILVDNHVSAFFHGHDHQYAYEARDGIVYQSLPAAGFSGNGFNIYTTGSGYTIQALPSPGHLRVTVGPTQATVDYVATSGGAVNYSYTINAGTSEPTHVLTTAVSPSGGGTISPAAGTHTYDEGAVVSIIATPNAGYVFDHWSGACTGTGACQVTMDDDKSVTATFTQDEYTLTVNVVGNGAVTLDPNQATYHYGDGVELTATADPDWSFAGWSGDVSSSDNPLTLTITGDTAVTATFTPESGILGDVNGDDAVNSTDALIVLSCDVGMDTSGFCPMNCGDVNADGLINSTDALIILSYDVGMSVPYPVGQPGCPSSVTPCAGCTP